MTQLFVHIFLDYFPNRLLQDVEYSSLYSTLSLCCLSVLCSLYLLISFSFVHPSFPFPFGNHSQSQVSQSCPTLCNPVDCSLPGSSIHGILQARILEWVAISFSRGSSQPRNQTQVSHIAGRHFTLQATREG